MIILGSSFKLFAIFIQFKIRLPHEVAPHVFVQVALLSERQVTVQLLAVGALKWPFFRVDP